MIPRGTDKLWGIFFVVAKTYIGPANHSFINRMGGYKSGYSGYTRRDEIQRLTGGKDLILLDA